MIPKQTIDEIYQTARVEEVIGEFVQLKKSGSNYKGKSPFVDERTPSFMVSPAKQIWKCFSSSKGGNVVSFLMEAEHFSYVEALKWLANKYNIEIKDDRQRTPEEVEAYSVRENLSVILEFAKNTFHDNLTKHPQGKAIGLSYFVERGFREDIIEKFQLGYCLDESEGFTKVALAKNYKLDFLVKAGLTKVKDNRSFDFYRGRVMFPIHSIAGKVLGFGGRTLKADKKIAKYFNSPESELYNKSKILYGLYFAKNAIIKYDNCFLVEGYTDVISMYQAGVENVVSSSGTSLTTDQIKLIKRYTENITILYDGDAAGIKASFRGIDMILSEGLNVKVVLFPDGEDPDSYAKKSTTEELKEYVNENAKDFIVFKSDVLLKDAGNDPLKKAQLINDIVGSVAVIDNAIKRQVYSKECATIFDIAEQTILQEVNKVRQLKIAEKAKIDNRKIRTEQNRNRPNQNPTTQQIPQKPQVGPVGGEMDYEIPLEAMLPPDFMEEIGVVPSRGVENELYYFELDLIRILLNYGTFVMVTEQVKYDENDKKEITEVEVPVIELIIHELLRDEIEFSDVVFNKILFEYDEGQKSGILYPIKHFTQHEDIEVCKVVADIITDRHSISANWLTQKKIRTTREVDKLEQAVMSSIYAFKDKRIKVRNEEIETRLGSLYSNKDVDSIEEQRSLIKEKIKLDELNRLLSNKLGRMN
ncbi:MAG: DNA primase [Crocinitomix sp.]|nr:DNA primase [Crocinitomix sp.]